jgi:crossover junction endodeoxyribonuclease RuvC
VIVIGIDPGKTGGIAVLSTEARPRTFVMPVIMHGARHVLDVPEIRGLLSRFNAEGKTHVFIEKQQPLPAKMGGGAANYQRGYGLGVLEATCHGLWLPYDLIAPIRWQRAILADIPGEDTKQRALVAVKRLYPRVELVPPKKRKPHEGIVDALLLAEYGRRRLTSQV